MINSNVKFDFDAKLRLGDVFMKVLDKAIFSAMNEYYGMKKEFPRTYTIVRIPGKKSMYSVMVDSQKVYSQFTVDEPKMNIILISWDETSKTWNVREG